MQNRKPQDFLLAAAALVTMLLAFPAPASAQSELTLEKAYLRLAASPFGPRKLGLLKVDALVNDTDDMGGFLDDLVADSVQLSVTADTGFDVTIDFRECELTSRGARCTGDLNGTRAKLTVTQYRNTPYVYRFKLRVKDIDQAATGLGPLTGPLTATLTELTSSNSRSDTLDVDECRTRKFGAAVRCKAQ